MEVGNIYINGLIGTIRDNDNFIIEKGVELVDVISDISKLNNPISLNVYINSPGGLVQTGFQIYDYLKSLKIPITTIGLDQVASIATVIFMAGDTRKYKKTTDFLVHLPMMPVNGNINTDDANYILSELETTNNQIINFYKKTTSLTAEALKPLLSNETSLSIEQGIALGFATEEYTTPQAVAYINQKNEKMTSEDKNWIQNLFQAAVNVVSGTKEKRAFSALCLKKAPQIVSLDTTDANGTILVFKDLADDAMPQVGDKATVEGVPADGEYLMPNGQTFVFIAGELTQINEPVTDVDSTDEVARLQAEIERLKLESTNQITNLKSQIFAKFDKKEPKSTEKATDDVVSAVSERLIKLKK